MKKYYVLLVHFFQYILITLSIGKMITIRIYYLKLLLILYYRVTMFECLFWLKYSYKRQHEKHDF